MTVKEWLAWNGVFLAMNLVGVGVLFGLVWVLKELDQPWFVGVAGASATAAACGAFYAFDRYLTRRRRDR